MWLWWLWEEKMVSGQGVRVKAEGRKRGVKTRCGQMKRLEWKGREGENWW